jgi:hypothetical protein
MSFLWRFQNLIASMKSLTECGNPSSNAFQVCTSFPIVACDSTSGSKRPACDPQN